MRLGIRQLEALALLGTNRAFVVHTRQTRRLCALGLLKEGMPGGMIHITSAGLRALANAADAGRIELFTPPKMGRKDQ